MYTYVVAPHITPFYFEGPVNAGERVQLSCFVSKGDKPLQIGWRFGGQANGSSALPAEIRAEMFGDNANILTIGAVMPQHRGLYVCTAKNAAGDANYTARLDVYGYYR